MNVSETNGKIAVDNRRESERFDIVTHDKDVEAYIETFVWPSDIPLVHVGSKDFENTKAAEAVQPIFKQYGVIRLHVTCAATRDEHKAYITNSLASIQDADVYKDDFLKVVFQQPYDNATKAAFVNEVKSALEEVERSETEQKAYAWAEAAKLEELVEAGVTLPPYREETFSGVNRAANALRCLQNPESIEFISPGYVTSHNAQALLKVLEEYGVHSWANSWDGKVNGGCIPFVGPFKDEIILKGIQKGDKVVIHFSSNGTNKQVIHDKVYAVLSGASREDYSFN